MLDRESIDELPIDGEALSREEEHELESADGPIIGLPDSVEQEELMRHLWADLRRGEHAAAVLAEAEMRKVIEFNQQVDHRFQEGMGQLIARIPLSVYLHWSARYGPEFWRQADSFDFLAKRAGGGRGNPGFMIRTKGRPTIIKTEEFPPAGESAGGGLHAEKPAGAEQAPAVPPRVRGRRGRWAA